MISFIICTYNRDKYIYSTLEHLAQSMPAGADAEVIVVDNNSTDNTPAECKRFAASYPGIAFRVIKEEKQGLSFARNTGIAASAGDVAVFLDDDAFVDKEYYSRLEAYLAEYPDAMAFGGRVVPLFETGKTPDWVGKWSLSWVSAIDKGPQVVPFTRGSYPIGANMGFRKVCFEKAGLFNTSLGRFAGKLTGGEEKDIFNRVFARGLETLYFPGISVCHVIPESRTTAEYISKLGLGVGVSEKARTLALGSGAYAKRIASEAVKWGGTLVLALLYAISFQGPKGKALIRFRANVTKGLLSKG